MDSKRASRVGPDRLVLAGAISLALLAPFLSTAFNAVVRSLSPPSSLQKEANAVARARCSTLHLVPGPDHAFQHRTQSDRFEGARSVIIHNVTVWTGEHDGQELLHGMSILLERGLISRIAPHINEDSDSESWGSWAADATVIQGNGAFVTPGIFDMHSHLGVDSAPELVGADDTNSLKAPVLPYLRSLDGINTHDLAYKRSVSGGVTTALILPGSANNIGGQAFVIKLRERKAKTPDSMVLEMPDHISGRQLQHGDRPNWRHMKMACGENIKRVYKETRMDEAWSFRSSFDKALQIKVAQDEFCAKVAAADKRGKAVTTKFPEELEWEALVDVLRGKVKVNTHCYEGTDLAAFVRHTNEFKFPLAAFHHAHETFLVPELLKSTYGGTPAVALFAINARYKREAWRGSEYAAKTLAENNITVICKSDHPVLDSRYLLFEAQQAHHFGLAENLALQSVTTAPAKTAGFCHRLGYVRKNYDADLVIWDSHPLALGATPLQVFIDGVPQLSDSHVAKELSIAPLAPSVASMPQDPLTLREDDDVLFPAAIKPVVDTVKFVNVGRLWLENQLEVLEEGKLFEVIVHRGRIECMAASCEDGNGTTIDLAGGSLLPPLTTYGTLIGLTEIIAEKSTSDGSMMDAPLSLDTDGIAKEISMLVQAKDGLSFGGKHLVLANEGGGVGYAVAKPAGGGFYGGLSVAFRTAATNLLDPSAIVKSVVAVHVNIGHYSAAGKPSIATQIAKLRSILLASISADRDDAFTQVVKGTLPLVIEATKADHIALLIVLKREAEAAGASESMRWIISGAHEAYLVADEIAKANISVILNPPRTFPGSWDTRRASPGPPLLERSAASILYSAGVLLAIGVPEEWQTRQLVWEASWLAKVSNGVISPSEALKFGSSNLLLMLGLDSSDRAFVAWEKDPMEFGSRVVARSTPQGQVELLQ